MPSEAEPGSPASNRSLVAVLGCAIFVTGLGWPGILGRLPFGLLLKNELGMPPQDVAAFWAIATFAWYAKPLVGLIVDGYPLGGTRRRGYLLAGAVAGAVAWLAFAFTPRRYLPFMAVMTLLNVAMVFVSTVAGGLQVEVAQRTGATGRLASFRSTIDGAIYLVGGPLAGWLAGRAFGWTAAAGALILFSLVPVVARLYPEPRVARASGGVVATAAVHLKAIRRSRAMVTSTVLMFLFYLAPGFQTPMLYYQQDVLKLTPAFMGNLQLIAGAGWIIGAAIYNVACRRFSLRATLAAGILVNGLGVLLYLRYDSAGAAVAIELAFNTLYMLGSLPLYDLAARAAPKGSESFSFGLMMSAQNVALFGISDPVGSYLYGHAHLGFKSLVWLNSVSTLAVLLFLPVLPAALLAGRERSAAG